MDESFKLCYSCMAYMKVKSFKESGNIRTRLVANCRVCEYEWAKNRYYRQLTLDIQNKVHKDGEWVVCTKEDRSLERVEKTLTWAYRELDEHTVNEVFYKALNHYWYKTMFTRVQNCLS